MDDRHWAIIILAFLVLYVIVCISGCQQAYRKPEPERPPTYFEIHIVKHLNWMVLVSIVGVALGIAAMLNGAKYAVPLIVGCLGSLGLSIAVATYSKYIAIYAFIVAGVVFIYSVFLKDRALKEIVTGGENFKSKCLLPAPTENYAAKEMFKRAHNNVQSKTTQQMVKKIKAII